MNKFLSVLTTLALFGGVFPSLVIPEIAEAQGGDYCAEYYGDYVPSSSNFTAHGLTKVEVAFSSVWGVEPGMGSGNTVPVPGQLLPETQGRYLAIPIVFTGDQIGNGSVQANFSFVEWQPRPNISYPVVTHPVSYSISPCPGDFRPAAQNSPDPYLRFSCRGGSSAISGNFSLSSIASLSGCPTPKGKKLYLNIATYDMFLSDLPFDQYCTSTCGVALRSL